MILFHGHRKLVTGWFLLMGFLATSMVHGRPQQNWMPGQPPPEFHVLEVGGAVQFFRPGSPQGSAVTIETALVTRDIIQTGPDGYLRIGLEDGSQVEVFRGSRVELGIPRSSWMKMLDLFIGQVRIMIERIGGRPNPYTFSTPTAVLGVRGTMFDLAVDESAATIVAVNEGSVQVENALYPGQGVLVKQGYRTIVRPYELPTKPERFSGNGPNFGAMARKHGKAMDPRAAGMMGGSQSGTMQPGSGTMGMPGGTMGMPGGGTMGMPGGGTGGMPGGMGGPKKKNPPL